MPKSLLIKGLNYIIELDRNELKLKKRILFSKKYLKIKIEKIKTVEQISKSFFQPLMVSTILSIILAIMILLKNLKPLRTFLFYKEFLILFFILGILLGLSMALIRYFFVSLKFKLNDYNHSIIVYLVNRKEGKKFIKEFLNRLA